MTHIFVYSVSLTQFLLCYDYTIQIISSNVYKVLLAQNDR